MVCTGIFIILVAAFSIAFALRPVEKPSQGVDIAFVIFALLLGPLLLLWGAWSLISMGFSMRILATAPLYGAFVLVMGVSELALGGGLIARSIKLFLAEGREEQRSTLLIALAGLNVVMAVVGIALAFML